MRKKSKIVQNLNNGQISFARTFELDYPNPFDIRRQCSHVPFISLSKKKWRIILFQKSHNKKFFRWINITQIIHYFRWIDLPPKKKLIDESLFDEFFTIVREMQNQAENGYLFLFSKISFREKCVKQLSLWYTFLYSHLWDFLYHRQRWIKLRMKMIKIFVEKWFGSFTDYVSLTMF